MWVGGSTDTFSEKRFRGRVRFMSVLFAAGYSVIALRLFDLQVVRGNDLAHLSESNRTQVIFLRAPRGDFFDRKGRVFVTNRPTWSLVYSVPEKSTVSQSVVEQTLKPFLEPFPQYWMKRLSKAFQSKQMVRLVENVPDKVAFLMREMELILPGLRVVMEFRRGYPLGISAPHLIGYLGEVGENEIKGVLKPGDLVGKMGIERIQDDKLRGRDGGMMIEVDSVGRLKRVIKELPFQKGGDVHLTLDLDVQRVAEEELQKTESKRGAAVAIDVTNGAILAWASAPAFDPTGSMVDNLKDPKSPFLDRVYKGGYPPGSTFKIITAIAGFEKEMIRTSEIVNCVGFVSLPDGKGGEKRYKCWKKHGYVDYWRAMGESCDSYFYALGKKIGPQSIADTAQMFGFGGPVQDTLSGENKGVVGSPAWKRKLGLGGWSTGDTYNMAIGQGYTVATPLQVAVMMTAIATHGQIFRTYALDSVIDMNGVLRYKHAPSLKRTIQLKESTWENVSRSLENVVQQGTGMATKISYLDVRGKTGTAQNPHGEDHAWFAGYAGYKGQAPKISICVFVENGGHGGVVSAPIVRRMLETALPDPNAPASAEATAGKPAAEEQKPVAESEKELQ